MAQSSALTDYEINRARNIERNNARLQDLGLISQKEEEISNDIAWKRYLPPETNEESESEDEYREEGSRKKRKKQAIKSVPVSPSRKSRRIQGLSAEGLSLDFGSKETEEDIQEVRQKRVEECRAARQQAALKYYELHGNDSNKKAAKDYPTATYEHCLMRVQTMTDKALANRVKAIERAVGKHCVVKMAIFKSCLQDEDKWSLAKLAGEALERLKGLQPPPQS